MLMGLPLLGNFWEYVSKRDTVEEERSHQGAHVKIAVAFGGQGADAEALCRGMLQAQRWTPEARIDVWPVAGGALGCVEGGERGSRVAFKHQGTTGNLLLVTGTPISLDGPLEKVLASCVEESGENAAAALRALHGVYAAIFWDARFRRLIVVTDDLGMQPLHLHRSGAKLFLSTDIKGIATAGIMRVTPDPQAWASFLSMGCSHGDRTLVSGIERCQPARVITYDPAEDRLEERAYWQPPSTGPADPFDPAYLRSLGDLLKAEIEAYFEHGEETTFLLSGGCDSRLIAGLLHELGRTATAVVLRHDDEQANLDGRMAIKVAKRLGMPVREHPYDRNYFGSENYRRYQWMSELCATSFGLFITYLWTAVFDRPRLAWDGLSTGCLTQDLTAGAASPTALFGQLLREPDTGALWCRAAMMLSPDFYHELLDGFASFRRHVTTDCPDGPDGAQQFMFSARCRHRTSQNPYRVMSNGILPMAPGFARPFIEATYGVPNVHRHGQAFALAVQRHVVPELARLPYSHAGTLKHATESPNRAYRNEVRYQRLMQSRLMRGLLRRTGRMPMKMPRSSAVVRNAVDSMSPDDPLVNADALRALQASDLEESWDATMSGQIIFYLSEFRRLFCGNGAVGA